MQKSAADEFQIPNHNHILNFVFISVVKYFSLVLN